MNRITNTLLIFFIISSLNVFSSSNNNIFGKFDFGGGKTENGYLNVTGEMIYTKERGYGFVSEGNIEDVQRNEKDKLKQDFCTSDVPFYFIVDIPEGFYEVKITFGDKEKATVTTVKAESRRLMLEEVSTEAGMYVTKSVMVNVRTPKINNDEDIRLKSREVNYLNWDNKLTIEFNNSRPCVNAIEIIERKDLVTIFLAGNSTVVDQEYEPWCSWGQMITRFLNNEVVVANYAESGESLKSFQGRKRFQKILSVMEPGDYVFIEFGHNDQKPQSSSYVEPFTGYKDELKKMIRQSKEKGGIPVIVSSTQRRNFNDNGKIINTHGDYPEAARQTAEEENVYFIDLTSMSEHFYEALGIENSKKAFVHYPANTFPGQEKKLADNTHFNSYGAYELAKCILNAIKKDDFQLSKYILDDFKMYNPDHPDSWEEWNLPMSPFFQLIKPDGY